MNTSKEFIWLFDYDLTLYTSEERYVLDSLDKRITEYVQKTLNENFENASRIRKEYLAEYGTTLAGLRICHGVLPDDFFDFIHVPEYLIYPPFSKERKAILESLPGKKIVFTNGRADWCEAGLLSMKIDSLFDAVFDLKAMDWEGKPASSAYEKMESFLKNLNLNVCSKNIVFLDDACRNLQEAKAKGWTTVLVAQNLKDEFADYSISSILELPQILPSIL